MNSPYSCAASVLFGARTIAGRCVASMTLAAVKVLPVPVAPSSTWLRSPLTMPSTSSAIAVGWSPAGSNSETSLNGLPPSSLARRGSCTVVLSMSTRGIGNFPEATMSQMGDPQPYGKRRRGGPDPLALKVSRFLIN